VKVFVPVLDHSQTSFLVEQRAFFQHDQHHPRDKIKIQFYQIDPLLLDIQRRDGSKKTKGSPDS
jgi:hypothetical protein